MVQHPDSVHRTDPRRRHRHGRMVRRGGLLLLLLIGVSQFLLPPLVWVKCGALDPQACVDSAVYTGYQGMASGLWLVNRTILLAAYYCYAIRWWVMDVSFRTLTDIFLLIIDPLLVPFALVALLLALLFVLLLPLTGQTSLLSMRGVLVWTVLAPVLLAISGPIMIEIDAARVQGAAALFQDVSNRAGTALTMPSSAQTDRMATPRQIYGSYGGRACVTSYYTDAEPTTVRSDELAAALFWATATDIQCPHSDQPLPQAWYDTSSGPGYAFDGDIGLLDDASERARHLHAIQQGINRLIIGGIPSVLALIDALIQLAFSLALVLLWIGLIVSLPFVFFQQQASPLISLFRRLIDLFTASWTSSVLLAILFAGILSLAQSGHALAVAGFSMGGIIAAAVLLGTALRAVKSSVSAIGEAVSAGSGINPARMVSGATGMATGAAGLALGAATGGAGLALTAAMAAKQTGSGRYAAAAALGRITPVRQLGAVASAMGIVGEETQRGLWAGSRRGLHVQQRQMQVDASRKLSSGLTMRETNQQRATDIQIAQRDRTIARQDAQIRREITTPPGLTLLQHGRRDAAAVVRAMQGDARAVQAGVQRTIRRPGYRRRQRPDAYVWAEDYAAWKDTDVADSTTTPQTRHPGRLGRARAAVGSVVDPAGRAVEHAVGAVGAADDWLAHRAALRRQQRVNRMQHQRDRLIAQRAVLVQQRPGQMTPSAAAQTASPPASPAADHRQTSVLADGQPSSSDRRRASIPQSRRSAAQQDDALRRAAQVRTAVDGRGDESVPTVATAVLDSSDAAATSTHTDTKDDQATRGRASQRLTPAHGDMERQEDAARQHNAVDRRSHDAEHKTERRSARTRTPAARPRRSRRRVRSSSR